VSQSLANASEIALGEGHGAELVQSPAAMEAPSAASNIEGDGDFAMNDAVQTSTTPNAAPAIQVPVLEDSAVPAAVSSPEHSKKRKADESISVDEPVAKVQNTTEWCQTPPECVDEQS